MPTTRPHTQHSPGPSITYGPRRSIWPAALVSLLFLPLLAAGGCGGNWSLRGPGGDLAIESASSGRTLAPHFTVTAYDWKDENSVDLYLSDLPAARLSNLDDDLAGLSGSLVEVHVFLVPVAGKTPIDPTACNVIIRHIVLGSSGDSVAAPGDPALGLYGGGGFLLPTGDPGDDSFGGRVLDATYRLIRSTPNFGDLLGQSYVSGSFRARRDETLTRALAARFENLMNRIPLAPASAP